MKRVDIAIVGCGHMGAHHARVVSENRDCRLVAVVDVLPDRAEALHARFGGEARSSVPGGVDVVIIATPTSTHVEVASPLLRQGLWALIEKPLAGSADEALALRYPNVVAGHIERFNPAIVAAGPMRPRDVVARRLAPRGSRGLDTDVVHDLMIHDLDLCLFWGEAPVDIVSATADTDLMDEAWAELWTADGMRATLHASRRASVRERIVEVNEGAGKTLIDLAHGVAWRSESRLPSPDARDALSRQLDAFIGASRGDRAPAVGFDSAWAVLDLADRVVDVARAKAEPLVAG